MQGQWAWVWAGVVEQCLATPAAWQWHERLPCRTGSATAVNSASPEGTFPVAGMRAERLDGIMARDRRDCVDNRFFQSIGDLFLVGGIAASIAHQRKKSNWRKS